MGLSLLGKFSIAAGFSVVGGDRILAGDGKGAVGLMLFYMGDLVWLFGTFFGWWGRHRSGGRIGYIINILITECVGYTFLFIGHDRVECCNLSSSIGVGFFNTGHDLAVWPSGWIARWRLWFF